MVFFEFFFLVVYALLFRSCIALDLVFLDWGLVCNVVWFFYSFGLKFGEFVVRN